ncbi:MAG TPA: cytochrome c [Candidatus Baltobacteraceae bacterium]|nr:cytochrome c [Candidatus Baltobacteraceae bacterium]
MSHSGNRICRVALPLAFCLLLSSAPLWAQGDGATLFKSKCAVCHGADGSGSTAVGKSLHIRDLASADVQKQTDAQLTAIVTDGKGGMPSYKDKLSGDQIKVLIGFIRDLAKKK